MALTPAAILAKNRIDQASPWLELYTLGLDGAEADKRIVNHPVAVNYEGFSYAPRPGSHEFIEQSADGRINQLVLHVANVDREVQRLLELYGGLRGKKVTMRLVYVGGVALWFDGVDDQVVAPLGAAWPQTNWTVEFWSKWAGSTALAFRCPLSIGGIGGPASDVCLIAYSTTAAKNLQWKTQIGGVMYDGVGSAAIEPNVWTHAALTHDGSTLLAYLDGELKETRAASGAVANADDKLVLGTAQDGLTIVAWDGRADEIRLWSLVRTIDEIKADMYRSLAGNETGLVGYWRCNEGTSTVLRDSKGQHGAITGAQWVLESPLGEEAIGTDYVLEFLIDNVAADDRLAQFNLVSSLVPPFGARSPRRLVTRDTFPQLAAV